MKLRTQTQKSNAISPHRERSTWLLHVVVATVAILCGICAAESNEGVTHVRGGPDSVVWVVQLSDLHFSVHHPNRALDFAKLVGPALSVINPSLVLITGDLTDGKSKDLLTMKQNEDEWVEYRTVLDTVIKRSRLQKSLFFDLRGNHDSFGVPVVGGSFDFFSKYSINGQLGRNGSINSVTLENCRTLLKAYEMNPVLHLLGYGISIPLLLAYAISKTRSAE